MAAEIDELATTRLVLIVPRGEGVAFEDRTLTEFFAAKRLTPSSDPSDILEALIPSAHWRHTWLLAADLVLHEYPYQSDMVLNRLNSIDQQTAVNHLVQPGALAAINALLDGFAANTPRWQRDLAQSALRLVDGPNGKHIEDLSDALASLMPEDPTLSKVVWDELDRRLRTSFAGAARTLLILLDQAPDTLGVQAQQRVDQYADSGNPQRPPKKPSISATFMTSVVDAANNASNRARPDAAACSPPIHKSVGTESIAVDWIAKLSGFSLFLHGLGGRGDEVADTNGLHGRILKYRRQAPTSNGSRRAEVRYTRLPRHS